MNRWLALALLVLGCSSSDSDYLYVYPDGKVADSPPTIQDVVDATAPLETVIFGEVTKDLSPPPDATHDTVDVAPSPDLYDIAGLDLPDLPPLDFTNELALPEPDLPPVDDGYHFPEVTDDCDPLGLPTKWKGTFEGEIISNIPDMMGYTFNGPCEGEISFEIKCVNQKYLVIGELDGGATNCALASGCPFIAKLGGLYNTQEQHLYGTLTDAAIDYSAVIVYAEGVYDGELVAGPALEGTWSGSKTDIENLLLPGVSLDWVDAGGEGTWIAYPDGE